MDISVSFPGGKRVDAMFAGGVVHTDQPVAMGGEGSAPAPFDLFLASLATCAGIYVLGFCQARGIPTDEIRVEQKAIFDESGKVLTDVAIEVHLPESFPEKYRTAVVAAANGCKVKKVLAAPPRFDVVAVVDSPPHGDAALAKAS
jgi:ribosomal protein S12 methylthiotransferase accessory factor